MGKIIRRVIAILLCATAVMLAVLPAGSAEATSTHGDYEYDGATVAKYLGDDYEVTLPAWVNRVGKEAFEGYDKMTKLVMPDTVTTVDFGAFSNCSNLQTVKMSESVRTLGSSAFSGCTSLYSISIPRTVREIGSGVFAGCPSLSNVSISPSNENYTSYDGVIYSTDGSKLVQYLAGRPSTTYQMPTSVKEIEEYAFWGANNLAKLSIANGVTQIPEHAFSNCKGLQHVTLPRSVQSIFAYAFENCDSLSYINIPDSVGYIDKRAFANTKGALLRFVDANGNVVKSFNSDDVESYGSGTSGGTTLVSRPDYFANAAELAAEGSNTSDTTSNGSTTYTEDSAGGATFDPTNVTPLDEGDTADTGTVAAVTTASAQSASSTGSGQNPPDSSQNSGQNSGQNSDSDNSSNQYNDGYYKASDSGSQPWDTKIEYHDFEDNMTGYDLGAGVVLGGTTVLRMSSDIPVRGFDFDNAEYEDEYGSSGYGPARQSDSDVIGDVFAKYNGDSDSVSVPAGVKKIGTRAFYRDGTLNSVDLPSSVTDIGEFAFARSALSDVSLPEGLKKIDYAAFYMCPNLTDVSIPQSVDSIALGAFDGTPYLEGWKENGADDFLVVGDGVLLAYKGNDSSVMIPENVRHIGPGAFSHNNNVERVVIPGTVSDIGEEAFCDCPKLRELILGDGIRQIDDRAFKNSNLAVVNIPESVEGIGLSAFDNGGKLRTVIVNGESIPDVTNNQSATRLSAKNLRTRAFEGAKNAIVSNKANLDSGTLFDPAHYGFAGEVYTIGSEDDKTLVLERALTPPDGAGNVVIDQRVDIAGDTYTLDHVKSDAFDNYRNWKDYYDNRPQNVSVNGEQSDELVSLLDSVNSDVLSSADEEDEDDINRSNITVSVNGSRFPTRGRAHADIPGDEGKYKLNISEDDSAKDRINTAFLHSTGRDPGGNYVPVSMDLYDRTGTVPIHKLGNSKMEVSMPVPTGMEGDDGVAIAAIDDNGALESLSSELIDEEGVPSIKFVTGHCSTFVIYSRTSGAPTTAYDENGNPVEIIDGSEAAAQSSGMSGTWQSLNKKVYGISAKWFIIIILVALAGVLLLYKPRKRNDNR